MAEQACSACCGTPGDTEINSHIGLKLDHRRHFKQSKKKRNLQPHQMRTIQHFPEPSVTLMLFAIPLMSLFALTRIRPFEITNCCSCTNNLETAPARAFAPVSHSSSDNWKVISWLGSGQYSREVSTQDEMWMQAALNKTNEGIKGPNIAPFTATSNVQI